MALLGLGGASYLVLLAANALPVWAEVYPGHGDLPNDAWKVVLDFGLLVLSVIAGLVLALVAITALVAALLRVPPLGWVTRWVARSRAGEAYFGESLIKQWLRCRWATAVGIANLFVGYDMVVSDFQPSGGDSPATTAIASAATDATVPADPYGQLANEATTVAAAVRSVLGSSRVPVAPGGVDYVRSSAQAGTVLNAMADAMKEVNELKWVAPLLRLGRAVMPRQRYTIEGHVFPAGRRGRGLSLAIVERDGNVLTTVTLWERTFDPALGKTTEVDKRSPEEVAEALYRLGVGAAAWVVFQVMEATRDLEEAAKRLAAANWQTYAYFLAGVECQQGYQWAKAEALYARALERDAGNLPALLNIAIINTRGRGAGKPEAAKFDQATARLAYLCGAIEKCSDDGLLRRNPLWYQAAYNLAAARLERCLIPGSAGPSPRLQEAYETALKLSQDLEEALRELDSLPRPKKKGKMIKDVLDRVEAPSLLLLADLASRLGAKIQKPEDVEGSNDRSRLIARLKAPRCEGVDDEDLAEYLVSSLGADEAERSVLSYRAHYNLACYNAGRAERAGEDGATPLAQDALKELRYAVEAGNITPWAEQDPALGWLRENFGAEFDRILAPYNPKRGSSELGRLRIVGRTLAATLQERGIDTMEAVSMKERSMLAEAMGTGEELTVLIQDAAGLGQAVGATPEEVNLLASAAILNRASLCDWQYKVDALTGLLREVNEREDILTQPPSREAVREWLDRAASAV